MASNKAQALRDEATEESTLRTIEWKGVEFTVSTNPMDWAYDTMDALADNRIGYALDGMLGPDNAKRFKALKPTLRDAIEVMNLISASVGVDEAGN